MLPEVRRLHRGECLATIRNLVDLCHLALLVVVGHVEPEDLPGQICALRYLRCCHVHLKQFDPALLRDPGLLGHIAEEGRELGDWLGDVSLIDIFWKQVVNVESVWSLLRDTV